jgi:peptide deformylase
MQRPIARYGAAGLQATAAEVTAFDGSLSELLDDLIETMHAAPGIGLAAPQIGVPLRVAVIDLSIGADPRARLELVNPEFVLREGMQLEDEGCLSVPGFTATVPRPARVVVRACDRHGVARDIEGRGLLARALQHEVDHLNGCLFLNRLRGVARAAILYQVRRLRKAGRW